MDTLLQRFEFLNNRLSCSLDKLNEPIQHQRGPYNEQEYIAEQSHMRAPSPGFGESQPCLETPNTQLIEQHIAVRDNDQLDDSCAQNDNDDDSDLDSCRHDEEDNHSGGSLVRDSYGCSRFVGGATNAMLIEAIQELTPVATTTAPRSTAPTASNGRDTRRVELPFFLPGGIWPDLPFLPKPEQLPRPPHYVADLLTGLYFDRIHYTFPVVFKPHFLHLYRRAYRGNTDSTASKDRKFLMVFFAVCACASSLLPSDAGNQLTGHEYFEKALLLYYSSAGEASVERVQCLALLALCTAGWNTLARSWMFAGQAVRAAMDIGIHLDNHLVSESVFATGYEHEVWTMPKTNFMWKYKPSFAHSEPPTANEKLQRQINRRIWWSVYTLDRYACYHQ